MLGGRYEIAPDAKIEDGRDGIVQVSSCAICLHLGLLEVAAPRGLFRFLGVRRGETLIALFRLREIGNGVAILSSRNPEPFVWRRVAGDALDIAALTAAFTGSRRKVFAGLALGWVAMITIIDLICAQTLTADSIRERGRIPDYSNRIGLPKAPAQMRVTAAKDFKIPSDLSRQLRLLPCFSNHGRPVDRSLVYWR